MAGFVAVAVLLRPVGGWLSDRLGPIPVLAAGYAVVVAGAAGGIGGFVPPLIMGYVYGRTASYGIGLMLLSVTAALTLVLTLTVVRTTASRAAPATTPPLGGIATSKEAV